MKQNLPSLKPGDLVAGRFRIVEMVGSGGFSVVYRAHQEDMNRFVALKVLKPRAANDTRVVERFRREALYASHLNHPNTITLYDYGQTGTDLFYIAMEFLAGMDLSVVVQRGEPMDLRRVWKILVQCCRSLAEAHRLGLVHRDLKPENIFLVQREDGGEFVKVLDFGVSKAISSFGNAGPSTMAPLTQEGTVFGTPLYMAPEQAMAQEISPAVDIYALGHIVFEMVTGRAAYWDCTNPMDVMLRQVNDPPLALPPPWDRTPYSRLITKCTQKNPRKRIADAGKLLEYLMDAPFAPYMDPSERPSTQRSVPNIPALSQRQSAGEPMEVEELYRWEFEVLEQALSEVLRQREPRFVIIRGKPGTGRSNLLRAFLRKVKSSAQAAVIHRQTAGAAIPTDAGLEADLAVAAGLDMRERSFAEIKRQIHATYQDPTSPHEGKPEDELDSGLLSTLMSMRDSYLARMAQPFRARAEQHGALVWGVENLERVDTLTVSFLDRMMRDLQAHHAPMLIIVTVSPDDTARRPGLSRYVDRILNVSRPCGRQMSLVPPGERKQEEADAPAPEPPPLKVAEELSVSGSYFGSKTLDFDRSPAPAASAPVNPHAMEASIFADAVEEPEAAPAPEPDRTFDRVIGYLAQLGDEIPYGLWRQVSERMLEEPLRRVAPLILEQAERFGIIHQTSTHILFTKPSYQEALRESFEQQPGAIEAHAILAQLLQAAYPSPQREQLKLVVSHLVRSEQQTVAIGLLQQAGQAAFRALDFDAAREYFLQIQQLLDYLAPNTRADLDGDGVADSLELERPRLWLRLGEIHGALHEHGAAEDALRRAISEALPEDLPVHGRAYKLLGDLSATQDRHGDALRHYERAQEVFRRAGLARAYVAVTAEMGHCALMQGQLAQAEQILAQAHENASRLRDASLLARVHRYTGQVLTRGASFLKALEHLEQSIALFESVQREGEVILCLEELGNVAYASSKYEQSRDYFTRAIAQSSAARVMLPRSPHLGLARALAALGNLTQAEVHLAEALATSETTQEPFKLAEVHLHLGDLYLAMQRTDDAEHHFNQVAEIARGIGHTRLWLDALIRQAYVAFDAEQADRSYTVLTKAAEMSQAIGDRDAELQIRTHIIYFQLLEHQFAVKGDTFSSLLAMGKSLRLVRTPVLCWLFRADVSASRGELTSAREELRQAYAHAAQLGDYAMFILLARRDYLLQRELGQLGDPHIGAGYALGALIPPEVGRRRFQSAPSRA